MSRTQLLRRMAFAGMMGGLVAVFSAPASAQGVMSEWTTVAAPPAPELTTVTVKAPETALLVMDINQGQCEAGSPRSNLRCVQAVPKVKQLLDQARAHHMLVVFSQYPHMAPFVKELQPEQGEQTVVSGADKFFRTDLDKILKDHGITTVITTGQLANGAVLFTAFGAASNGYKVLVPVDAMPGDSPYAEQSTVWNLANDPGLGRRSTTLTSVDRIQFDQPAQK